MTLSKNFSPTLLMAFVFVLFDSCTDQRMNPTDSTSAKTIEATTTSPRTAVTGTFDKSVGRPIDRNTALRWMDNFKTKNVAATAAAYDIDARALAEIIGEEDCIGISLHYAIDGAGNLHILPIGINSSAKIIAAKSIATKDGRVDWATGQQWINAYSGPIRSHFFGANTFTRLLADKQSEKIKASLAVNDDGVPQLLLSNANDPTPSSYEDESFRCPPNCAI